MKKIDWTHPRWNRILAFVYAPLVFFCYIGGMAGERAIGETNLLIVAACHILGSGLFTVSLATYPALILSGKCFEKGRTLPGHLLRWFPVLTIPALCFLADLLFFLAEL